MRRFTILTLCLSVALGAAGCAPETPRLDVPEDAYAQEFNAKIVNLDKGEKAYYTLDGSEPTQDSILYTQDGIPLTEGENQVRVIKFNTADESSEILTAYFTIIPQKPQLDTPNGVYNSEFAAKIVNLMKGYEAYYTLDGSKISKSSNLYTEEGIHITEGENHVQVIKFDSKGYCSPVLTAKYTVSVQTPRLDTPDGEYDAEFAAKIVNLKKGYKAYFTLDGSEPNQRSNLYTEDGIPITEGETHVKVIKFDAAGNFSEVLAATFTVPMQPPRLATPDGVYNAEFAAKIANLQEGYKAYFTLDGTEPSESSKPYTEAGIPLKEGVNQVKVIKYDQTGTSSAVLTANLTIVPHKPDYSHHFTTLHKQGEIIYYIQSSLASNPRASNRVIRRLCSYNLADGSTRVVLDAEINTFIIQDGVVYYDYSYGHAGEDQYNLICSFDLATGSTRELLKHKYTKGIVNWTIPALDFAVHVMIDDWIYYQCWNNVDGIDYVNLHKMNVNTLISQQLTEQGGEGPLLLVDGNIIYDGPAYNPWRFNVDTAENTKLSSDDAMRPKVFGDFLYYYTVETVQGGYSYPICRVNLNGSNNEQIPGINGSDFVVVGDRIFYGNPNCIQSARIDGADVREICDRNPHGMQYYQGKIFFYVPSDNHISLYCLDIATDQDTLLQVSGGSKLYFLEGETYLVNNTLYDGKAGLYKLTKAGLIKLAGLGD